MLSDHSTAALEAELKKRKSIEPLEQAVCDALASGISMQDIRLMLARVSKEQEGNVRNMNIRNQAAGKY